MISSLSDQAALLGTTAQVSIAVVLVCAMTAILFFLCWSIDR